MSEKVNYEGKQIGNLTILRYLGNSQWQCQCGCGEICIKKASSLSRALQAKESRIGCPKCMSISDKTGQRFGRLTVMGPAPDRIVPSGQRKKMWHCLCDCGTEKDIDDYSLVHGRTQSCGCIHKEVVSQRKGNAYDLQSYDFGVGWTNDGYPFFFDKEDYELLKPYTWYTQGDGYLITHGANYGKVILMHRLILRYDGENDIDHIHGNLTRNDNRKENLRIVSRSENNINRDVCYGNTGVIGVHCDQEGCYRPNIGVNGKTINLGLYETLEEAVKQRRKAEKEYYPETNPLARPKDYINPNEIIGDKHA